MRRNCSSLKQRGFGLKKHCGLSYNKAMQALALRRRNMLKASIFAWLTLFGFGCSESNLNLLDDIVPVAGFSEGAEVKFLKCEPTERVERQAFKKQSLRLSRHQFELTIEDLFMSVSKDRQLVDGLLTQIKPQVSALPVESHLKMDFFDSTMTVAHVEQIFLAAIAAADFISSDSSRMDKIVGACHRNLTDLNCRDTFIQKFGRLVHRRPLSLDQLGYYQQVFQNDANKGYRQLLVVMLSSPGFVYRVEGLEVDGYDIASRLSYFYLQSMPDEELFSAAEGGMTAAEVTAQVDRLMKLPVVRKRLTRALANQWLHLDKTHAFDTNSAAVQSMLSGLQVAASPEQRRLNMIQEVYDFLDFMIWEKQAKFEDLFLVSWVFPRTPDLAEIYGTPVWSGDYNQLVAAPDGQRAGLLTLAHTLFMGGHSTRPIMRGVKVYEHFLCGELPTPEDNSIPEGIVLRDDFTEREKTAAITQHPGTSCVSCHLSIINPFGFSLENYGPFGKFRQSESIFHPETHALKGQILTNRSVSAETEISMPNLKRGEVGRVKLSNATDLAKALVSNSSARACFAKNVYQFARQQEFEKDEGGCAVRAVFQPSANQTIIQMLSAIAQQPEFIKSQSHSGVLK